MDLEGTVEKVQEISSVLVQARNLPGGPRRYCRKSAGNFICTGAGQEPSTSNDLEVLEKKGKEISSYWWQPGTLPVT